MNKAKSMYKLLLILSFVLIISSCSYKAYMGLHGSSIRLYPEIHAQAIDDKQCLECHHPDNAQGPVTPHPGFTGCLKCHNDEV